MKNVNINKNNFSIKNIHLRDRNLGISLGFFQFIKAPGHCGYFLEVIELDTLLRSYSLFNLSLDLI